MVIVLWIGDLSVSSMDNMKTKPEMLPTAWIRLQKVRKIKDMGKKVLVKHLAQQETKDQGETRYYVTDNRRNKKKKKTKQKPTQGSHEWNQFKRNMYNIKPSRETTNKQQHETQKRLLEVNMALLSWRLCDAVRAGSFLSPSWASRLHVKRNQCYTPLHCCQPKNGSHVTEELSKRDKPTRGTRGCGIPLSTNKKIMTKDIMKAITGSGKLLQSRTRKETA